MPLSQEQLLAKKVSAFAAWSGFDNVVAVGPGRKLVNGAPTGDVAIAAFVKDKNASVPPGEAIPPLWEGIKTDVVEVEVIREDALIDEADAGDTETYDALMGGISIESAFPWNVNTDESLSLKHTAGCVAQRVSDSRIVMLTSYHALLRTGPATTHGCHAEIDTPLRVDVGHPGPARGWCGCCDDVVGENVLKARFTAKLDAAMFELVDGGISDYRADIVKLGPKPAGGSDDDRPDVSVKGAHRVDLADICGVVNDDGTLADPNHPPYRVRMRGRSSRYSEGFVSHFHCSGVTNQFLPILSTPNTTAETGIGQVGFEEVVARPFEEVVVVTPSGAEPFSKAGDSGAVYLNDGDEVIGLHFGGGGGMAFGSDIDNVLLAFDVNLVTSATPGVDHEIPVDAGADVEAGSVQPARTRAERRLLEELATDPAIRSDHGRNAIELFRRHRREVLGLIESNRRIAVRWHRLGGPEVIQSFMRSAYEPSVPIPCRLRNGSWASALEAACELFFVHGSSGLKQDIERYGPMLTELGGVRLGEAIDSLKVRPAHPSELLRS